MPSMMGTEVLQVLSLKQNFLAYGSETSTEFYLLNLSDGWVSGVNSICPDASTPTSHHVRIIKFYIIISDEYSPNERQPL
jgi:hypothetical protein